MRNPRAQIPTSRHLTELLVHQSQAVQAHLSRKDFSPKTILHGAPFGLRFWCSSNFLWPGEKGFSLKKEHFCHCTLVLFFKAVSSHFGAHPSYLEQTGSRAPRRDDVSAVLSLSLSLSRSLSAPTWRGKVPEEMRSCEQKDKDKEKDKV